MEPLTHKSTRIRYSTHSQKAPVYHLLFVWDSSQQLSGFHGLDSSSAVYGQRSPTPPPPPHSNLQLNHPVLLHCGDTLIRTCQVFFFCFVICFVKRFTVTERQLQFHFPRNNPRTALVTRTHKQQQFIQYAKGVLSIRRKQHP